MTILSKDDIHAQEKLIKVQLATSLPGIKPVCLVGTTDIHGAYNLSIFSSITHFGSSPLILGMVTRPATVERHTLNNILETKCWTLNHIHKEILPQAHQTSAKYPKKHSEFVAVRLTPHTPVTGFVAPSVLESKVQIGLKLADIIDIPVNGTQLILGEVEWVNIDDHALEKDGSINFNQTGTLGSTALDTYFSTQQIAKLPYARP